jgi:hypothetical protein
MNVSSVAQIELARERVSASANRMAFASRGVPRVLLLGAAAWLASLHAVGSGEIF